MVEAQESYDACEQQMAWADQAAWEDIEARRDLNRIGMLMRTCLAVIRYRRA